MKSLSKALHAWHNFLAAYAVYDPDHALFVEQNPPQYILNMGLRALEETKA